MIKNNGGDGNFGGTGTIAIVDNNEGTIIETIQEATEDYDFYGFENWLGST